MKNIKYEKIAIANVRSSRSRGVLLEKVFLIILQYWQEKNTCVQFSFNQVADLKAWNFIKKRLQHMQFPVNNEKFLRTSILKNIYKRLLLMQI